MTPTAILQQFAASAQEIHDSDKEQRMVFAEQGISLRSTGGFFSFFAKKEVKRAVREENTRTWEVFTRALSDVLGRDKVAEISTRYGLDLERIQAKAKPLLAKHVEIFSVGSSRVFTRDIKRLHADQKLKTLPTEEIIARLDRITPFPVFGEKLDPLHISGTPTTLKTHLFHDPLLMDKEAQALLLNAGEITFKAWQERFCKCTINRELEKKQVIPAPGRSEGCQYYKVYRKIASGNGLICYALTPVGSDTSLMPALYFRPTQMSLCAEDALETCMDDFSQSIGEDGYATAREALNDLMGDPKFCPADGRIRLGGYSLGGAYAQRFLVDHWNRVRFADFYNDPSLDNPLAEGFAEMINALPPQEERLDAQIYRMEGDVVDYGGEKHIGWGVNHPDFDFSPMEYQSAIEETRAAHLHGSRMFDSMDLRAEVRRVSAQRDRQLDNAARGPLACGYEHTRKVWGRFFYCLFFALRIFFRCFSRITGKQVLRSSSRAV